MSDPISFDTTTPRFLLPLLYAGQAQKEVFVNETFYLADALLHCIVEGEAISPPASPADGTAWIVSANPTGDWAGKAGRLACRQGGQWLFVSPRDGMRIINRTTGQDLRRLGSAWIAPVAPTTPSGGSVVDSEARAAIAGLVQRLRDAGVFAAT